VIFGNNQYATGHARLVAMDGPFTFRCVFPETARWDKRATG
jgi:hypothetical protein